ncbi:HNH endonuclease, partial [Arenibacterium halophilum]
MGALKGRGLPSRLKPARSRVQSRPPASPGEDAARRSKDWLNTARWQRLRRLVLARDNHICQQTGVLLVAGRREPNSAVVDHIKPHRGDPEL